MTILIDSIAVVILILGWWIALSVYPRLPERIPTHFGFTGEVDAWGRRWTIFMTPLVSTVIFALDFWLFDYATVGGRPVPPPAKLPLHLLLLELTVIFTYITWRTSEVAFEKARGLGAWFLPVTFLVVFATCGWMWVLSRGH